MTRLISQGAAQMRVLSTTAQWFGMTYREDKESVEARIANFVESDIYPGKLWG
jgi:hypothetical protein